MVVEFDSPRKGESERGRGEVMRVEVRVVPRLERRAVNDSTLVVVRDKAGKAPIISRKAAVANSPYYMGSTQLAEDFNRRFLLTSSPSPSRKAAKADSTRGIGNNAPNNRSWERSTIRRSE